MRSPTPCWTLLGLLFWNDQWLGLLPSPAAHAAVSSEGSLFCCLVFLEAPSPGPSTRDINQALFPQPRGVSRGREALWGGGWAGLAVPLPDPHAY